MTFKIPAGVLAQHVIALGKTGAGKSSAMRVLVEGLLDADKPVCIIDPKGDWWGIKSSAEDHMRITDAGLEALGPYEPLPTGDELVQYWRNRLGDSGKRAIFDAVVQAYPGSIDVDEVSRITGIARTGGTWRTYMAELRGLGIIEGRDDLQASVDFFS